MSGTGEYRIHSFLEGKPLVGVSSPIPLPGEPLLVAQPVRINGDGVWKLTQLLQGTIANNYEFAIVDKYKSTGVTNDVVIATNLSIPENRAWTVNYIRHYDAYTIALADDKHLGWTASEDSHDADIKIKPIVIGISEPPRYSPAQLFKLHKLN